MVFPLLQALGDYLIANLNEIKAKFYNTLLKMLDKFIFCAGFNKVMPDAGIPS